MRPLLPEAGVLRVVKCPRCGKEWASSARTKLNCRNCGKWFVPEN
jgi:ribosomal protein S27E